MVCEENPIHIICPSHQRIVLHSVFFGAAKNGLSVCPKNSSHTTFERECGSPSALEVIKNECHGRQRCDFVPSEKTLGRPACGENKRPNFHFRVVYTCVSGRLVKDPDDKSLVWSLPPSFSPIFPTKITRPTFPMGLSTTMASMPIVKALATTTNAPTVATIDPEEVKRRIEEEEKILKAKIDENILEIKNEETSNAIDGNDKNENSIDVIVTPGEIRSNSSNANKKSSGDESTGMMSKLAKLEADFIALEHKCNCTIMPPSIRLIGFLTEWMSAVNFVRSRCLIFK